MIENTVARNCQFEKRISLRDSSETFANLISIGTSCSKFEAGVIAEKAHEVFRLGPYGDDSTLQPGQMIWKAIDALEPPGKPLSECIFKTIRLKIKSKQDVFDLIRKIDSHADIYMALKNPGDELWDKNESKYIQSLKMFGVTQPISMLLAAHQKFSKSDFVKLLNIVSVISFRYNVIGGLNPNEQEKVYNKVGLKISTSENVNLQIVKKLLMQIYVSDESFKASFSQKSLKINGRNKKLIKYILFSIERHLTSIAYDLENDKYSIEHIFPENPNENWDCFNDDQFIERIGNYVVLEVSKNRDIGNKDFNAKRIIYKSSLFALTKRVEDEYTQWNESNLQKHQDWMAKQAITVWKLNNI